MDRDPIEDALRQPAPDEPSSLRAFALDRSGVSRVRGSTRAGAFARHTRVTPMLAVLAVTVALALTWQVATIAETAPSPPPAAPLEPSTTANTTSDDPGLRFDAGGFSFAYPETWTVYRTGIGFSMGSSIAILGTADLSGCSTDSATVDLNCAYATKLDPGDVLLFVGTGASPGGSILDEAPPGGFEEFFDGMPAVVATSGALEVTGQDEGRTWTIGMPGVLNNWYLFHASMRGPSLDELREQVDAVVHSVRFDHPAPALPTDPDAIAAALRRGIDALDRDARESYHSRMYACFPREPRASARATIEDGPGGPLAGPLDVTCSVAIGPTVVGLWQVTLSVAWEAGPGYAAATYEQLVYLDAHGEPRHIRSPGDIAFPATRPDVTPGPATTPIALAPGSLVEILPPGLMLYLTPDLDGDSLNDLPRGSRLWVIAGPRSVDGESWYRVQWQPTPTYDAIPGWMPATIDGHPVVAPVAPRCPASLSDVVDLVELHPAERLACFGSRPITLGPVILTEGAGSTVQASGSPSWLADAAVIKMFGRAGVGGVDGPLLVRGDPNALATLPTGALLEVTGHFDDPASPDCRRSWAADVGATISPESIEEQVLSCREQFVVTAVRSVPAP